VEIGKDWRLLFPPEDFQNWHKCGLLRCPLYRRFCDMTGGPTHAL
jgi:hypothetical protein